MPDEKLMTYDEFMEQDQEMMENAGHVHELISDFLHENEEIREMNATDILLGLAGCIGEQVGFIEKLTGEKVLLGEVVMFIENTRDGINLIMEEEDDDEESTQ